MPTRRCLVAAAAATPVLPWSRRAAAQSGPGGLLAQNRLSSEIEIYDPRPPAPATPFTDASGAQLDLSRFRGTTILLNFWATWCAPCVWEMPTLDRLQAIRGDRLQVVAVSVDRGGTETIERFFDRLGIEHLAIFQDRSGVFARAFRVRQYPSTFLVDPEGLIIAALPGVAVEWDSDEALSLLDALIDGTELAPAPVRI